jgi:hypothetical protein
MEGYMNTANKAQTIYKRLINGQQPKNLHSSNSDTSIGERAENEQMLA